MSDATSLANTAALRSSAPTAAASGQKITQHQRSKSGGVLLAACKNVHERGRWRSCVVEEETPSAGRHADAKMTDGRLESGEAFGDL
jgi:hypothetical protein